MKNKNRHDMNLAQAARTIDAPRANDAAHAPATAGGRTRREGLFVPFAAFASLAGAAGLPFVSF